jgi:hypothetical protein
MEFGSTGANGLAHPMSTTIKAAPIEDVQLAIKRSIAYSSKFDGGNKVLRGQIV